MNKKIKVTDLDIIVTMIQDKPYFEIKYKKVGNKHYNIGYSSYNLNFVLDWKRKYFELVPKRNILQTILYKTNKRRNKYVANF